MTGEGTVCLLHSDHDFTRPLGEGKCFMKTYGDLFDYLESKLRNGPCDCDHTLWFTKEFARKNDLSFGELSQILEEMLGHCDCEVLLNSSSRIEKDCVIGKETFETPKRKAIRLGMYCHCRVDGVPVDFMDAVKAKNQPGKKVEWHVPCKKDDPFASLDLNRAIKSQA